MIATLSREQEDFLLLMGKPNDGRMECFVGDGERILAELLQIGLAYRYKGLDGKFTHDLTDEGQAVYKRLKCQPPVIEFSGTHSALFDRDTISFGAYVNSQPVECRISYEALITHFQSRPGDKECEQTFLARRIDIETRARKLIEAGRISQDGILRIHS
jgi:hypothetical protein